MLLLLLPTTVIAFFFPSSGRPGCSCACAPASPCPPMPTCAIPGPCPSYPASSWTTVPAIPALSAPEPIPYSQSLQIMSCSSKYSPGCHSGSSAIPVSVPAPPPVYIPAASQTYVPSYVVQPSYPPQSSYAAQPPIPTMIETQEDRIVEVVAQQTVPPTLLPPVAQPPVVASSYDDTVPPPPPPIPQTPIAEYKTTETIIPTVEYQSSYAPKEQYEESTGVHSGEASNFPKIGRKVSTEGFMEPLNVLNRRNLILKRMRNVRTMGTTIPHTNATCNSNKLANVMARAIVPDVSVAKRMVMRSAELAFDGAKFDVFCATGEFSYSIHSRKYCEVTRDEVTCFAFR